MSTELLLLAALAPWGAPQSIVQSGRSAREFAGNEPTLHNLGLTAGVIQRQGDIALLSVYEPSQGADLNGDGDQLDYVAHVLDLEDGAVTNIGMALAPFARSLERSSGYLHFLVPEDSQGSTDLNGDGDAEDAVLMLLRLPGLERILIGFQATGEIEEDWIAFQVSERIEERDLNSDGDTRDRLQYLRDLTSAEEPRLLGPSFQFDLDGQRLVFLVSEFQAGRDINGDGDLADFVPFWVEAGTGIGKTLAYGEIAEQLGDKSLAREVGAAMARNRFPIVVPCHRVLGADGKLGGFSAPGGLETKLRLLSIEGVQLPGTSPLFSALTD